jgi:hypothetical protein
MGITVIAFVVGCGDSGCEDLASLSSSSPLIDGTKYLLLKEPQDSSPVIKARQESKDGEEVVLLGRIGGSRDPWIKGRAAFSIVDPSLRACSDILDDKCPRPWDYCCELDKLEDATVFIKFVDEKGKTLKADARKLLNLKPLQTVVVRGTAVRDNDGNLTVLASGIYARPGTGFDVSDSK